MTTSIVLPKLGFSMTEAVLSEWLIPEGGSAVEGQPLYTLESDKSVQEVESPATGVLRIIGVVGETYPVGHVIGEIS
jgi:pyruvate/2-oxoglutarate dehydrogenase complex dihydrolipoamide acyltransferase (E2) component